MKEKSRVENIYPMQRVFSFGIFFLNFLKHELQICKKILVRDGHLIQKCSWGEGWEEEVASRAPAPVLTMRGYPNPPGESTMRGTALCCSAIESRQLI